eukprot:COSAG02_NODE_66_length_42609_cov_95.996848_3_plen_78_part_00
MVTIKFTNSLVIIEHNNGNGSVENSRSRQTRRPMIRFQCFPGAIPWSTELMTSIGDLQALEELSRSGRVQGRRIHLV